MTADFCAFEDTVSPEASYRGQRTDLEPDVCTSLMFLDTLNYIYNEALPRDSYGKNNTNNPAAINNAPDVYTGATDSKFPNIATMGADRQRRPI